MRKVSPATAGLQGGGDKMIRKVSSKEMGTSNYNCKSLNSADNLTEFGSRLSSTASREKPSLVSEYLEVDLVIPGAMGLAEPRPAF